MEIEQYADYNLGRFRDGWDTSYDFKGRCKCSPLYSVAISSRRKPTLRYSSFNSMLMLFLPRLAAALPVENVPANGSRTVSPPFELAAMILFNSSTGFCEG